MRVALRNSHAFSLLELLLVLAVVGIMLTFGGMSIGTLRSTSLSTATRQFADYVNLCRSRAIAKHTVIRIGIVVESENADDRYRRYSSWAWNKRTRNFEQLDAWSHLPADLVFESAFPVYLRDSRHAAEDASSIRGDYLLGSRGPGGEDASSPVMEIEGQRIRFFEFSAAGRARMPSAELRNLIVVLRPGEIDTVIESANWSQFNIDTLTGRVRIYRP